MVPRVLLPSPMLLDRLSRVLSWTGLMAEPGRWQLCQIAAIAVFSLLFARARPKGRRALPLALGVLCAAVFACLVDPLLRLPAAMAGRLAEPLFRGVIVSYGALGGLVAGIALAEKARSHRASEALDAAALPLGAVVLFSRLGCLLAGCDFGRPTNLPFAIAYGTNTPALAAQRAAGLVPDDAIAALPVHPTQAYEMVAGGLMMVAAYAARRGRRGGAFAASVGTYAVLRFGIEWLRGDPSPAFLGVRLAGWISVGVLAAVVYLVASSGDAAGRSAERSRPLEARG